MKYRKLDSDDDYVLGLTNQNFLIDRDAVAQAIKTNLLLLYGEWWENLEKGLPLFESILGLRATEENKKTIDFLLQTNILEVQGVTSIQSFESVLDGKGRSIIVNATVDTEYGSIEVEVGI